MSIPEPGLEIVPGLTLLRPLGRGGMGEAWLARDDERGEEVVAKVLPPGAPAERLALLRREARLVRKLSHPRIVPVYGFRSGERGSAVTLRYMRGGDAGRRRGAPPAEVVRLGRDVAEALEYLHGLGVVHRDVKASNVLLDDAGRAHLADFGIASVASGDEDGLVLRGGGSRASMSPQQRAGEPAAPADDLYALGVLLFELLSGRPPFPPGSTDEETRTLAPPPVASPFPVPDSLRALVAALLARSAGERPASATAVKEKLGAIESELAGTPWAVGGAGAAPPPVRLQPPPRVVEGGVVTPLGLGERLGRLRSRPRTGLSSAQLTLLAGLGVAAVVAVVWLPRWAQLSSPPPPASAPAAVPSEAPPPSPPPPVEAPPAVASPLRAEEPPARTSPAARPVPASPQRPATPAAIPIPTPAAEPTPDRQAEAQALARQRDAARAFEEREEWREALRAYEAALAVDPLVAFALEGRERAGSRAALQAALDFHVRNAARLSAEAVAREAEALLERARGVESPGPRHRAQLAALERALADARTTVAVQLESDGQTELVLSRVGRLGTLTRRTVELRPGTYTVVGSRRGYRDVRRQFTIAPGSPAPTVVVRCEEAI